METEAGVIVNHIKFNGEANSIDCGDAICTTLICCEDMKAVIDNGSSDKPAEERG